MKVVCTSMEFWREIEIRSKDHEVVGIKMVFTVLRLSKNVERIDQGQ